MPASINPCLPPAPLWMPLFRFAGVNLAAVVHPEVVIDWAIKPSRITCEGNADEAEDEATEDDDLDDVDSLEDDDSNFDDFDDEFDDDFEEDESDPDWDHPDDLRPEAPPPGKSAGGKK